MVGLDTIAPANNTNGIEPTNRGSLRTIFIKNSLVSNIPSVDAIYAGKIVFETKDDTKATINIMINICMAGNEIPKIVS